MASERDRKKVDELPVWEQVKASFRGGYANEAAQKQAVEERENAMREALKRRRASAT